MDFVAISRARTQQKLHGFKQLTLQQDEDVVRALLGLVGEKPISCTSIAEFIPPEQLVGHLVHRELTILAESVVDFQDGWSTPLYLRTRVISSGGDEAPPEYHLIVGSLGPNKRFDGGAPDDVEIVIDTSR